MLLWLALSAIAQNTTTTLIRQFREAQEIAKKEQLLNQLCRPGSEAGERLLQLAKATNDNDTRWLAIRGLGMLKFEPAARFLIDSLASTEPYVRANAARALGEIHYASAADPLIHLLNNEQDHGVIEQTSLALRNIGAKNAVPALKAKMSVDSKQTRCWLLDAIATLGSRDDLPFIAKYLYKDSDMGGIALCAARGMAAVTGQDFGLPKATGLFDPSLPVMNARKYWDANGFR